MFFAEQKMLFHRLRKKLPQQLVGGLDVSGAVNRHALSNLILRPGQAKHALFAILGLFNSKAANWWFVKRYGVLMEVGGFKVSRIPLPGRWGNGLEQLSVLVKHMLDVHIKGASAKASHDRTALNRQIAVLDRQIDQLVYELYGLTDEEIRMV